MVRNSSATLASCSAAALARAATAPRPAPHHHGVCVVNSTTPTFQSTSDVGTVEFTTQTCDDLCRCGYPSIRRVTQWPHPVHPAPPDDQAHRHRLHCGLVGYWRRQVPEVIQTVRSRGAVWLSGGLDFSDREDALRGTGTGTGTGTGAVATTTTSISRSRRCSRQATVAGSTSCAGPSRMRALACDRHHSRGADHHPRAGTEAALRRAGQLCCGAREQQG